jgi:hypothetical protein
MTDRRTHCSPRSFPLTDPQGSTDPPSSTSRRLGALYSVDTGRPRFLLPRACEKFPLTDPPGPTDLPSSTCRRLGSSVCREPGRPRLEKCSMGGLRVSPVLEDSFGMEAKEGGNCLSGQVARIGPRPISRALNCVGVSVLGCGAEGCGTRRRDATKRMEAGRVGHPPLPLVWLIGLVFPLRLLWLRLLRLHLFAKH